MSSGRRIRDPVHGFIHFTDDELRVIDSPYFQRLRGIKQLALTFLVYPGAMHTRFEHSLGVMEMATRAFDSLRRRHKNELKKNFSQINLNLAEATQLLRLTALLHDVGHLPFSHAAEGALPQGLSHEDVSVAIINKLRRTLDKTFYKGIASDICRLIDKKAIVPPELQILKKLISSQLDVDRADYLLRDSLHCGVEYGKFDYLRLFEMLRVSKGSEGGLELAVDIGGIHSLEALVLARYYMFAQVYFHKVRRIYDIYLKEYMNTWSGNKFANPLNVSNYTDDDVHRSMISDSQNQRASTHQVASRILARKHHKLIFETSERADARDKRDVVTLYKGLRDQFKNGDFKLDTESVGTIHKFYVHGDEIEGDDFKVFTKYSSVPISLTRESCVIDKLPKHFAVYRIYADAKVTTLEQYRKFARKEWRQLQAGG